MTLFVGLAMAEVCSSYPTAGGLYYWAAKLAPKNGAGLGLVHRLVQLPRPGGGDGGHRLRRGALHQRLPATCSGASGTDHWETILIYARRPARARPAQPVRRQAGRPAQRHQRVVAHRRRADHRRRAAHHARATTSRPSDVFTGTSPTTPACGFGSRVRRADRPADRPVHAHRLRRLRAHDRGDARGRHAARAAS